MTSSATGEGKAGTLVRAGVVAWLLFVALLPIAPALVTGQVPWVSDIRNVFGPLRAFSQHGREGDGVALWNPFSACGIPHATDLQVAAWYPPNWVIDRIQVPIAMTVEIVVHLVLLGGLTYLAARLRGAGRRPAPGSALRAAYAAGAGVRPRRPAVRGARDGDHADCGGLALTIVAVCPARLLDAATASMLGRRTLPAVSHVGVYPA